MKNKFIILLFTFFCFLTSNAQCAMCRAVLESGEDQSAAVGINDGIMFLMVIPYILVGTLGYIVYIKFIKPEKTNNSNESV
ncbi:hypothetical protein [Winogradskyella bathintestinalis]|uniref:Uncharacterized protein n=1 Tax=Winogradskyella bathintestinalis TaxID=3035208 RepID=A0ABT7ZYR9_9FLAO|nr:hypothetical protein [Winogradskyella bathintestinalis]MDN3494170.1 hypothetical protein [Winogradskyella bathintestinalis]